MLQPLISGFMFLGLAVATGIYPAQKLIRVIEAKSEMQENSAGRLRAVGGWSVVAIWAILTAFAGSFIGDWIYTGDLDGATARAGSRLELLVYILMALAESD